MPNSVVAGNIGNEVTDELLSHSFGRYPSLARAKVIRNKHTNKSKGFARGAALRSRSKETVVPGIHRGPRRPPRTRRRFISFMDPFDCAKALREMSGKYIGDRPRRGNPGAFLVVFIVSDVMWSSRDDF